MNRLRRRLPGLALIAVLATAAAVVWGKVLTNQDTVADRVRCPPQKGLTALPHHALREVTPVPPGEAAVSVSNATSRHDLAARVATRLEQFGFATHAPPANDRVYETDALRCHGQIRFGPRGESAARTVHLVAPCLQLVRDQRTGQEIDVVLGTEFLELSPNQAALEVLSTLRDSADEHDTATGGLQSATGGPEAELSPSVLDAAQKSYCSPRPLPSGW
ncbi:envelope integrity protein Cei [Actinophytocola sp. NPDC049390]|uniref:envelope integrity protein Cei n=1 Tax=Actinophytocola sp. NPDC049390 TaxID=3363894 RepID=UPI0037B176F3